MNCFSQFLFCTQSSKFSVPAAGLSASPSRLGSSVDEFGHFYKPLQDGQRGDREIEFYNQLLADAGVPPHIRGFFPKYFGIISIGAPDSGQVNIHSCDGRDLMWFKMVLYTFLDKNSLQRHGVMEDLTHGFRHPSIIDLKVGARTWCIEAGEDKIKKSKLKDQRTTSGVLGFRVSGMQVYEASKGTTFRKHRDWARNLSVDGVTVALKQYVSSNPQDDVNPNAVFAASVYGGPHGVIAQLEVLKEWFGRQTSYHFTSSSILLIYEGDPMSSVSYDDSKAHELDIPKSASVKFIDFAHTVWGKNSLDDNCFEGLKSVISLLSSIVNTHTT